MPYREKCRIRSLTIMEWHLTHVQDDGLEVHLAGQQGSGGGRDYAHADRPLVVGAVGGLEGEWAVGEGHQEAIRAVDRVQAGVWVLGLEGDLVPAAHCMQLE